MTRDCSTTDPEPTSARETLVELIAQAAHLPPGRVAGEAHLRELGFDSLRHFQLMLEIERTLGVEFDAYEIEAILCCATVDDLCASLPTGEEVKAPSPAADAPSPEEPQPDQAAAAGAGELIRLANECWVSRCLHTAVRLRLADHLGDGPLTIEELARRAEFDRGVLSALLTVLSSRGIFAIKAGAVQQTVASALLRTGRSERVADIIEWMGSDEVWATLGQLPHARPGGVTGFEAANGEPLFAYLARQPDRSALFDRHMEGYTRRQVGAILDAVDLSPFRSIVDLGAGSGFLAASIAEKYPDASVAAFDLPGCGFTALAAHPHVETIHGDFFVDAVPPAELLILCNVLHDWSDEPAQALLANVARNCGPGAHLFIIEGLPESREAKVAMVDLGMAVTTGGRQRTFPEYAAMLSREGFDIHQQVKCSEYLSVLVARRR